MADDITLNAGTGGDTLGCDDIGGVKYQRVKLIVGANNTNDGDVASGNPLPISDAAGSLTVDGSVTVTQATGTNLHAVVDSGAVTANAGTNLNTSALALEAGGNLATISALSKAEDAAHSSGNTGVMLLAVREATATDLSAGNTDGDYEPLQVDANGALHVITRANASVAGGIAHDGADSGNPNKIGAKAKTSPKGLTLVADNDRSDLYCDLDGILIVKNGTANADVVSERVSNTDGASTGFSTFGATANLRNCITAIAVHNAHATTNGYIDFRDGTAGAIIWTLPLPATGGATIAFDPPLRQPTANTALAFDVSAAITTIYISINGFQSKA